MTKTHNGTVHKRCGTTLKYDDRSQCVFCSCFYRYSEYDPVKVSAKNRAYRAKVAAKELVT